MAIWRHLQRDDIVRIRGERWRVRLHSGGRDTAILHVVGCDRENGGRHARFVLPHEPTERLELTSRPRLVRPAAWRRAACHALAGATPLPHVLRAAARANIDLLPFQLEPALAITHGHACRMLVADEVGLGKTIQAGLCVAELLERDPAAHALIVTPAALRDQWRDELDRRFSLRPAILDSTTLAGTAAVGTGANPWAAHALVIASIDFVKRPEVLRALERVIWDIVVLDEAHALSGRSDRSVAASEIAARSRVVVMLTATPHTGDDNAFTRLCQVGDLHDRFPLRIFRRTRGDAGMACSRRVVWLRVAPTAVEREMHVLLMRYAREVWRHGSATPAAQLAMAVLVRRACSSAGSLARSLHRRLTLLSVASSINDVQMPLPFPPDAVDDEEPDGVLGAAGLEDMERERRAVERLMHLARRAAATESKVRVLRRLLSRLEEPAIVFTEYRDTLATLQAALGDYETVELHGGLSDAERRRAARRFTEGGATVLLATDAASEGLNLQQRCRTVINLELPWTPLRLEQRVGRVDRIGQSRRVHQIHFVAARTAEERTVLRLVQRAARARDALRAITNTHPDASVIAAAVFNGTGPPHAALARGLDNRRAPTRIDAITPAGDAGVDLRAVACDEARRLEQTRALLRLPAAATHRQQPGAVDIRPAITVLRRRSRRRQAHCAYRVAFIGPHGEYLWETLLGVIALAPAGVATDDAAREWLRGTVHAFTPALDVEHARLNDRARLAMESWMRLALSREDAIAERIRAHHTRMAAALVQPALFDRRLEREVESTADVLAHIEALHEQYRLQLTRWMQTRAGTRTLTFAAVSM